MREEDSRHHKRAGTARAASPSASPPDADSGRGEEPLSTSLGVSGPAARGPFSDGGHSIRTFRARFGRTRFDRTPGPCAAPERLPRGDGGRGGAQPVMDARKW